MTLLDAHVVAYAVPEMDATVSHRAEPSGLTGDDEALARWWTRDHVGRALSALERRFLGRAARMLDELAPRQVDPALCAIVAAGTATLIALIPHRSLGSLTLAVTVTDRFITVSWASIYDLGAHDDLDLSREVYLFHRDKDEDAMCEAAVAGLRAQLTRRFTLRVRSTGRDVPMAASCYLQGADGRLRRVARLPSRMPWTKRLWRWGRTTTRDVSFADVSPPPYAVPSRAAVWFRAKP
jgi:hypothetical protein